MVEIEQIEQIGQTDFKYYGIEYDYDTITNCEENGCEYICRCGIISNQRIESIEIPKIAECVYQILFDGSPATERDLKINSVLFGTGKNLHIYCIDRILRIYEMWNPQYWDIEISPGYYGEELNSIKMLNSTAIQNQIGDVLRLNTVEEKINFLLKLEYGYVLPEIEDCKYHLDKIKLSDVVFGSDGHYRKVSTKNLNHYVGPNYDGIRAIVKEEFGGKYKVLDGYHRLISAGLQKSSSDIYVDVIIAKNE